MYKKTKGKKKRNSRSGIVHVYATFNNTIVTVTNPRGHVIAWSSGGAAAFKGTRKATPFAAQVAAENAGRLCVQHGIRKIEIRMCGPGRGRDNALRALQALAIPITVLRDVTPVPHNGCRPPKKRRV